MQFNKLLEFMRLKPDDYDEDEVYDDEDYFEEEPQTSKKASYDVDDEPESPTKVKLESYVKKNNKTKNNGRVISMQQGQKSGLEVCVIKPKAFGDDVNEIVEVLLKGRAVVLNLAGVPNDVGQRIIDYTSGACTAINGNMQKIASNIIIATPNTVDLSGDFFEESDIYNISKYDY